MIKLYKYRWVITVILIFYSVLSVFVEYFVAERIPASDPISIFVAFYFLCNSIFVLTFFFHFVRIVKKYSMRADARGSDDLSE